jgi:glycosyltransferase involved in cell wall biosynthesis
VNDVTLTIVIPAYNEAANLTPVVHETLSALQSHGVDSYELLIVDDGSRDATGKTADALAAANPAVRVLRHPVNRGLGAALRTGFSASRGRYVTLISADGEIEPAIVLGLLSAMGDADLMVGMRERTVSAYRNVLTFGFDLLTRLLIGFVPDAITVYIIRGELLRRMDLQSETGLASLEVRLYCQMWGCRVRSGHARVRPRLSGESKVTNARTMVRTFWEMVKLRRALRKRRAAQAEAA